MSVPKKPMLKSAVLKPAAPVPAAEPEAPTNPEAFMKLLRRVKLTPEDLLWLSVTRPLNAGETAALHAECRKMLGDNHLKSAILVTSGATDVEVVHKPGATEVPVFYVPGLTAAVEMYIRQLCQKFQWPEPIVLPEDAACKVLDEEVMKKAGWVRADRAKTPPQASAGLPGMFKVESSNIAEFGYKADTKQLYVRFVNGGLYRYNDVPQAVVTEFAQSNSKGIFLSSKIKTIYTCTKV